MTLATLLLAASLSAAPSPSAPATLVGAGALGPGGAAWLAEAGYPQITVSYAQGLDEWNDLGGTVAMGWTTGEMTLALQWRSELAGGPSSRFGFRLLVGPRFDFGATYIWSNNQPNVSLLLAPGVAWTATAGEGLVSVLLDSGVEWAFQRGMGFSLAPRLALAYEVPVARDVSVGALAGIWVRWGWGSAAIPGMDARLLGDVTAFVTWKVF